MYKKKIKKFSRKKKNLKINVRRNSKKMYSLRMWKGI